MLASEAIADAADGAFAFQRIDDTELKGLARVPLFRVARTREPWEQPNASNQYDTETTATTHATREEPSKRSQSPEARPEVGDRGGKNPNRP